MAEENQTTDFKEVIARIKREGDLNRNSGTNSIKSLKDQISKFETVFESISLNTLSTANTLDKMYQLDLDAINDKKRNERLNVDDESDKDSSATLVSADTAKPKLDKEKTAESAGLFGNGLMQALFGAASLSAIAGLIPGLVARGVIFGGLAALVSSVGEDLLNEVFENVGFDESAAGGIASSISGSAVEGLTAAIINKRLGVGVFVGGVLGDLINSQLSDEQRQNQIGTALGQEINTEDVISNAMKAAGVAAMFGGPLAGVTVAIAGLGIVMMDRVRDWIEAKRDEELENLSNELETRMQENESGRLDINDTSALDNIANRLFNIAGDEQKSDQAILSDLLNTLEEERRTQQSAVNPTLDYYGDADQSPGSSNFGEAPLDASQLDPEVVRSTNEIIDSFMGDALEREGAAARAEILASTNTSINQIARAAEMLGRDDVKSFLESVLEDKRTTPQEPRIPAADPNPTLSFDQLEGLSNLSNSQSPAMPTIVEPILPPAIPSIESITPEYSLSDLEGLSEPPVTPTVVREQTTQRDAINQQISQSAVEESNNQDGLLAAIISWFSRSEALTPTSPTVVNNSRGGDTTVIHNYNGSPSDSLRANPHM